MKDPIMADRQFTEDTLVIATHNAGKMREIGALFAGFDIDILSAADLGLAEPDETETSFTGNAILKAREAAMASGKPALADDSGLAVTALDGAPGIYSARWAGPIVISTLPWMLSRPRLQKPAARIIAPNLFVRLRLSGQMGMRFASKAK
jgi:XTP/dITP diphosphohydrolase